MCFKKKSSERGDTLIEVLLAMAILSAIIVGAITMMNRGHAIARDSLERSQVTALMTEQAEMLRYVRDSYDPSETGPLVPPASLWEDLTNNWTANAEDAGCKANANPFYLRKTLNPSGQVEPEIVDFDESTIDSGSSNYVETHAKPGSGLWVEAEPPAGAGGVEYIDFYIKGCWSPSGEGPQQEAKTIVRLYMPTFVASPSGPPTTPPVCTPVAIGEETFFLDSSSEYHLIDWEPTRTTYSLSPAILSNIKGGCMYNITVQTADYSHPHTPPNDSQIHEQVSAWFYKGGTLVTNATGLTDDFPDSVTINSPKDMGNFCFMDSPDTLTFKGYYATTGVNGGSSVQPYRINLTPVSSC